ncbi:hypothetical protein RhiLY_08768 [Ceratobasidium sp. AG-Ba]|nr:hypothetical protein RhiLY_08768 [Ceratobasidium sp. AG-Ba]
MSDNNLGIGDFDSEMAASKARREQYARTKVVAAQEVERAIKEAASEGDKDEDEEEEGADGNYNSDDNDGDRSTDDGVADVRSDTVSKSKDKQPARANAKKAPAKKVDPERARLLDLLAVLLKIPINQLELFDTEKLQRLWDRRVGEKAAEAGKDSGSGAKAKSKAKAKSQSLATPKPKRLKATVPMKSSITMVGSPVLALKEVEKRTAEVMASPLVSRKRGASVDEGNLDSKRVHLDKEVAPFKPAPLPSIKSSAGLIKPLNSRAPSSTPLALVQLLHAASLSRASSRASSRAPSVPPIATLPGSRVSSISRPATNQATKSSLPAVKALESDLEDEEQGLGDGTSEEYQDECVLDDEDEDDPEPVKTTKGGRKSGKGKAQTTNDRKQEKKARPSTRQFEGVERDLVDRAVECTLLIRSKEGFFPDPASSLLSIHEAWTMACEDCKEDAEDWPINQDHITVIRSRVSSFRSRGRSRINNAFWSTYNLAITEDNPIEQVKERAKSLYPLQFHRNPKAKSVRGGHYRHPFLPEAVYLVFFTRDKPIGVRFAKELPDPTISMVALACTMLEDLLIRYGKDGCYIKEEKGAAKANQEQDNIKSNTRSAPKDLAVIFARHESNLRTFQNSKPPLFAAWVEDFCTKVRACGGKKVEAVRHQSQADSGVLDASAFDNEEMDNPDAEETELAPPASTPRVPCPRPRAIEQASDGEHGMGNMDEEMSGAEPARLAVKNGRSYEPLSDGVDWAAGNDNELADDTAQTVDGAAKSAGSNQNKQDAAVTLALGMDEDVPMAAELDDVTDTRPVPGYPEVDQADVTADALDESTRLRSPMKRGTKKLQARKDALAAPKEATDSARKGNKGRKQRGTGLVVASKAVSARKGKGKAAGDGNDNNPVEAAPRATRGSAKLAHSLALASNA